jgi:hypothetical protein
MTTVDRYVHALWCDDIRQELGNKPSFMGVYTGGIVVAELPVVLPRLSIFIWIVTPIDVPFKKLSVQVIRSDDFVLLDMQNVPTQLDDTPLTQDATRRNMIVGCTLTAVQLPEGCRYLEVKVDTESGPILGPKLIVHVGSQVQSMHPSTQLPS